MIIEGYATVFDEPDLSKDIVLKGAFNATLGARHREVKML